MKQDYHRIRQLVAQYLDGTLSGMDETEFWGYVDDLSFEPIIKQLLSEKLERETTPIELGEDAQIRILSRIYNHSASSIRQKRMKWLPYAAAAVLIAAIGTGFFLYNQLSQPQNQVVQLSGEDVQPGGNRAVLKLADGKTIVLNEGQSGIVLSNTEIRYGNGEPLTDIDHVAQPMPQWLELATPLGGTYQVTLPDSTRVWLNAGSVLRYPSRFENSERVVELLGEAYFEVAVLHNRNQKVPFLVKTDRQTVEVLGTQFNVSAYAEDEAATTTLVEGSIRIASATAEYDPVMLSPGEQSVQVGRDIAVASVDVRPFIAWKEGYFHFKSTPFRDMIMRLARWYNIELVYEGEIPLQTFSGKMSRNISLQNVLRFFKGSGIQFTVVDRKLIVEE